MPPPRAPPPQLRFHRRVHPNPGYPTQQLRHSYLRPVFASASRVRSLGSAVQCPRRSPCVTQTYTRANYSWKRYEGIKCDFRGSLIVLINKHSACDRGSYGSVTSLLAVGGRGTNMADMAGDLFISPERTSLHSSAKRLFCHRDLEASAGVFFLPNQQANIDSTYG